jgi:hypothetical protein
VQIKLRDSLAVVQVGSGFEFCLSGDEPEGLPSGSNHRRGVVLDMDPRGITRC